AFDDATVSALYTIKKDSVHSRFPVVALRDASLKTGPVVLKFEVVENEAFKPGEKNNTWRKLTITDKLVRPASWDGVMESYYWGKYSTVKHQFMIDLTGKKWDQEFMAGIYNDFAALAYYNATFSTALVDYNNAHPNAPLRDEDGELMLFP
ncbi:MAG: DUF4843 domain-containing protein, partial [Chitinophagaceae bacterium]|nr:DUF4843 domain-containing protein [Chitinophagaceae bacterium]